MQLMVGGGGGLKKRGWNFGHNKLWKSGTKIEKGIFSVNVIEIFVILHLSFLHLTSFSE